MHRYREIKREVKRKCFAAEERWINEECDEIEELANRDAQMIYERAKELTGNGMLRIGNAIMKKKGKMAMEKHIFKNYSGMSMRWK